MAALTKVGYECVDANGVCRYSYFYGSGDCSGLIDELNAKSTQGISQWWTGVESDRVPPSPPAGTGGPIQLTQLLFNATVLPEDVIALYLPEASGGIYGPDEKIVLGAAIGPLIGVCDTHLLSRDGAACSGFAQGSVQESTSFYESWTGAHPAHMCSVLWQSGSGQAVRLNHFQNGDGHEIADALEAVSRIRYRQWFAGQLRLPTTFPTNGSTYKTSKDLVRLNYLCANGGRVSVALAAPDQSIFDASGHKVQWSAIPALDAQIIAHVTDQHGSPAVSHVNSYRRFEPQGTHLFFIH